jgi:hypothetical protein
MEWFEKVRNQLRETSKPNRIAYGVQHKRLHAPQHPLVLVPRVVDGPDNSGSIDAAATAFMASMVRKLIESGVFEIRNDVVYVRGK